MTDHERDPAGPGATPEGHTPEHPEASELGKEGTPGAGHAEPRLGPIDWPAWAYGLAGVGAGVLVIVVFWVAVS